MAVELVHHEAFRDSHRNHLMFCINSQNFNLVALKPGNRQTRKLQLPIYQVEEKEKVKPGVLSFPAEIAPYKAVVLPLDGRQVM